MRGCEKLDHLSFAVFFLCIVLITIVYLYYFSVIISFEEPFVVLPSKLLKKLALCESSEYKIKAVFFRNALLKPVLHIKMALAVIDC